MTNQQSQPMTLTEIAQQAAIEAIAKNCNLGDVPFHDEIADAVTLAVLQHVRDDLGGLRVSKDVSSNDLAIAVAIKLGEYIAELRK